jgi:hypothetical protein
LVFGSRIAANVDFGKSCKRTRERESLHMLERTDLVGAIVVHAIYALYCRPGQCSVYTGVHFQASGQAPVGARGGLCFTDDGTAAGLSTPGGPTTWTTSPVLCSDRLDAGLSIGDVVAGLCIQDRVSPDKMDGDRLRDAVLCCGRWHAWSCRTRWAYMDHLGGHFVFGHGHIGVCAAQNHWHVKEKGGTSCEANKSV